MFISPSSGSGTSVRYAVFDIRKSHKLLNEFFITDIYFHQNNEKERQAALELRDAVLRLRRDGAFVAVPLRKVFFEPMGPHPVGMDLISYLECGCRLTHGLQQRFHRDVVSFRVICIPILVSVYEPRRTKVRLEIRENRISSY